MQLFNRFLVFVIIIISCSSPSKEKDSAKKNDSTPVAGPKDGLLTDYFKLNGDSAEIPSFEIEVQLDEKAGKEIKNKKESIIVAAYFSGEPKDTTKYMEDGEYAVANHSIELFDSRLAKFSGIKISKTMYESLANKDIQVLINVYSGRRSSKLNLLDCGILQKRISEVKDQKFILKGKLIGS